MTMSSVFFIMATLVVGIVGFFLSRTLVQLSKTLVKLDTTLTDVQQVLDHAERVVTTMEAPLLMVANTLTDLQRGTRNISMAIDRFGLGIARPLAMTASVLGSVTDALGITSKNKGGNHGV